MKALRRIAVIAASLAMMLAATATAASAGLPPTGWPF